METEQITCAEIIKLFRREQRNMIVILLIEDSAALKNGLN